MKPRKGGFTILLLVCLFSKQTEARYIFLLPTKVSYSNTFRMSDSELSDFLTESLTMMGVSEMDQISINVLNFGYARPLPFPAIALTPNTKLRLNLQTSGIQSQSRRSIAMVGEKFLNEFENIMLDIERIHEDTQALPLAIFVQTKSEDNLSKLSSHPMRVTPYLVGILL